MKAINCTSPDLERMGVDVVPQDLDDLLLIQESRRILVREELDLPPAKISRSHHESRRT